MDTNLNNIHINAFTKGMNTDASYDTVSNEQYVFGKNIRISSNALLNNNIDSNNKEGIVTPVPSGIIEDLNIDFVNILATGSIENIGAIVTDNGDNTWSIYKIVYDLNLNKIDNIELVFTSNVYENKFNDRFSIVMNKELGANEEFDNPGVLNVYIADGINETMCVNILDVDYYKNITNVDQLISNNYFPDDKLRIDGKIQGRLHTSQIQYTYRFYKRHGIRSKLAPLTNRILVIDNSRNKEQGNAEDTETNIGFRLLIKCDDEVKKLFDHIQVYRLSYLKPDTNAKIELIHDVKISGESNYIKYDDNGTSTLQELSIEEFAALDSLNIVPQCIEQNQNYMFAANVKDLTLLQNEDLGDFDARAFQVDEDGNLRVYKNTDVRYEGTPMTDYNAVLQNKEYTLNRDSDMYISNYYKECIYDNQMYLGGFGKNVNWRFVVSKIPIHDGIYDGMDTGPSVAQTTPPLLYYLKKNETDPSYIKAPMLVPVPNTDSQKVFEDNNLCNPNIYGYDDLFTSSMMRSLRRDEVYRYGIVLYDKHGKRSEVQWIGDIRTPDLIRLSNTETNGMPEHTEDRRYDIFTIKNGTSLTSLMYNVSENSSVLINRDVSGTITYYGVGSQGLLIERDSFHFGNIALLEDFLDEKFSNHAEIVIKYHDQMYSNNLLVDLPYREYKDGLDTIRVNASNIFLLDTPVESNIHILASGCDMHCADGNSIVQYVSSGCIAKFSNLTVTYEMTISQSLLLMNNASLLSKTIGIEFDVHDLPENIVGYQIVRCSKDLQYTKNITQCVIARPIRLRLYQQSSSTSKQFSPYYPNNLFTSQFCNLDISGSYPGGIAGNNENTTLFLAFCPEILTVRNDLINKLQNNDLKMDVLRYVWGDIDQDVSRKISASPYMLTTVILENYERLKIRRDLFKGTNNLDYEYGHETIPVADKSELSNVFYYYNDEHTYAQTSGDRYDIKITDIKDVLNPTWELGFSNIQLNGSDIISGVKQYKSYSTSIRDVKYNNWNSAGMYDLRLSRKISQSGYDDDELAVLWDTGQRNVLRDNRTRGLIGPGPVCFLMRIDDGPTRWEGEVPITNFFYHPYSADNINVGCFLCNIKTNPIQYAGLTNEDKQYDVYYGFGNYHKRDDSNTKYLVFDGDVYITPCEIITTYKTYDFNSVDTIPSGQFVYYVPMESVINTFFDYGMNYKNTQSKCVQLEPGEITGVTTQSRPLYQYNMIYSDNNKTNDVFTTGALEKSPSIFPQRIHYSELKTNGEAIDSWGDFKPVNYIDADTRYGEITSLLTSKDTIYYWQTNGFGKLSVNERSLITDTNNNTIQLGQGGVLQRTDYLSTKYGMRKNDHARLAIDNAIFWIDIVNNAIVQFNGQGVVNYGEQLNVQNIINNKMSVTIPTIDYDILNDELLCKCLKDGQLLIFNLKYNVASSIYSRTYVDTILFSNVLYGINNDLFVKYNYIDQSDLFLTPLELSFVVNAAPSTTKVFDTQLISTMYRSSSEENTYFNDKQFVFSTNIENNVNANPSGITDREGNIRYSIPRCGNSEFGNRIRGKWMKVNITDNNPDYESSLSHIITKFRQSFS